MRQKMSLFFALETKGGNYFGSGTNHWFTQSKCTTPPWVLGLAKFQRNTWVRKCVV